MGAEHANQSPRDDVGMPDASSPTLSIVDGPEFVLAPHRLFVVFDDAMHAIDAIRALATEGSTSGDVWVYAGDHGAEQLDPHVTRHGLGVALVRIVQRVFTNDCEYCELLATNLHEGHVVIAVELHHDAVALVMPLLEYHGGHSFAYGEHWNFVPIDGIPHAVGVSLDQPMSTVDPSAPDASGEHRHR
jgi:hypothetical protein